MLVTASPAMEDVEAECGPDSELYLLLFVCSSLPITAASHAIA
jgi:hypothetical protein